MSDRSLLSGGESRAIGAGAAVGVLFQAVTLWSAMRPRSGAKGLLGRLQSEFDSVRVSALKGRAMAWLNSSAVCTTSTNIALITPLPQSALPQAFCHRRLPDTDDFWATTHRTARPLTEIKQQDP